MKATKKAGGTKIHPRIRITHEEVIVLCPGKIELLEKVVEARSLNQAAKEMGMSYMKAWLLVKVMNTSYKEPLLKMERGGRKGGGAELTDLGKLILRLYQEMHQASLVAIEKPWKEIRSHIKKTR